MKEAERTLAALKANKVRIVIKKKQGLNVTAKPFVVTDYHTSYHIATAPFIPYVVSDNSNWK